MDFFFAGGGWIGVELWGMRHRPPRNSVQNQRERDLLLIAAAALASPDAACPPIGQTLL